MTDDGYIHGTGAPEQARLGLMNRILNEGSLRELAVRPGDRVLDVGCGLAELTRAIASAAGLSGRVVGVERSREQIEAALALAREAGEEGLVDLREGDALRLPLAEGEPGSFDVVHARFLLEHVRDPLAVVRGMVLAARPGGRIVLDAALDAFEAWGRREDAAMWFAMACAEGVRLTGALEGR
ncbi:MAG: methyltransferase domain-containing protein [Planctomycetes bacterium]|nr:methyltransferase domain-containing protein [Planctomycetota bacterium]